MKRETLYNVIAGVLTAAIISLFGLALNTNTYLYKIDKNSENIDRNTSEIKVIKKEQNENYIKILDVVTDIKVELQNKKNKEN